MQHLLDKWYISPIAGAAVAMILVLLAGAEIEDMEPFSAKFLLVIVIHLAWPILFKRFIVWFAAATAFWITMIVLFTVDFAVSVNGDHTPAQYALVITVLMFLFAMLPALFCSFVAWLIAIFMRRMG
jgi:hypothetical protein